MFSFVVFSIFFFIGSHGRALVTQRRNSVSQHESTGTSWICLRWFFDFLPRDSSPFNHHLGEYVWYFFPGILYKQIQENWVVVPNIFHFHPYLGKIPILTNIFQRGWNHQLEKCCWRPPPPEIDVEPPPSMDLLALPERRPSTCCWALDFFFSGNHRNEQWPKTIKNLVL